MTILVTGGSGFLGRNLIRALLAQGETVRALHRRSDPPFTAAGLGWHRHIFGTPTDWDALLHGVTRIFHLAWSTLPQSSNDDPTADAVTNIGGTLDLMEALRRRPVERLVFASSGGTVYGAVPSGRAAEDAAKRPLCAYGVSKLAVENYLSLYERQWGQRSIVVRLANPFGPDQELGRNFGVVATFVANALAGRSCTIFGDGAVERDFVYVDDAVAALVAAVAAPDAHGAYNVGSGEGRSIAGVVRALESTLRRPVDVVHAPARSFDPPRTVLDASRAAAELNWRPQTPFQAGLERVVEAHRTAGTRR
jgi:UDP-glucose 4-epimerase